MMQVSIFDIYKPYLVIAQFLLLRYTPMLQHDSRRFCLPRIIREIRWLFSHRTTHRCRLSDSGVLFYAKNDILWVTFKPKDGLKSWTVSVKIALKYLWNRQSHTVVHSYHVSPFFIYVFSIVELLHSVLWNENFDNFGVEFCLSSYIIFMEHIFQENTFC